MFYSSFSHSHKIMRFFDSNTVPTSYMTPQSLWQLFSFLRFFFTRFSRLIASFVGASVIGHGIMEGNMACQMSWFANLLITDVRFNIVIPDQWILKTDLRSKYVFRRTTYCSGIPTWISHHLSSGKYLEYHKISLWESVQIYEITHTGIKDGSSSTVTLYVDSSTVCGFFLSWQGAPPQNRDCSILDCVEFYMMHTFLNPSVESLFKSCWTVKLSS